MLACTISTERGKASISQAENGEIAPACVYARFILGDLE
jgi:hypothetical protein